MDFKYSSVSKSSFAVFLLYNFIAIQDSIAEPFRHHRCSERLENALKHMRRRSIHAKSSRSLPAITPYTIYHSIYGSQYDDADQSYNPDRSYYAKHIKQGSSRPFAGSTADSYADFNQKQQNKIPISKVEVEDLRVKLPQSTVARWVEVEKCKFSTENSTLDTRLIFPDLTISGKVIMQPTGGKCSMILRLRHAGIEFRTVPIGFENFGNEESRRIGSASVRTDSHFAEPGFISVFAHSCQAAVGNRVRQNSKRRFGNAMSGATSPVFGANLYSSVPEVFIGGGNSHRWGKLNNAYTPAYDIRSESYRADKFKDHTLDWENTDSESREYVDPSSDGFYRRSFRKRRSTRAYFAGADRRDQMTFNDDILNVGDDFQELVESDARAFADIYGTREGAGHTAADDILSKDMENLFSMGVRGLLTTYMQRALQPAIKETLMENMGYTLSYG